MNDSLGDPEKVNSTARDNIRYKNNDVLTPSDPIVNIKSHPSKSPSKPDLAQSQIVSSLMDESKGKVGEYKRGST
jgi:hypothetical protein